MSCTRYLVAKVSHTFYIAFYTRPPCAFVGAALLHEASADLLFPGSAAGRAAVLLLADCVLFPSFFLASHGGPLVVAVWHQPPKVPFGSKWSDVVATRPLINHKQKQFGSAACGTMGTIVRRRVLRHHKSSRHLQHRKVSEGRRKLAQWSTIFGIARSGGPVRPWMRWNF